MAPTRTTGDTSSWLSKRTFRQNIRFSEGSTPFILDKGLLAKRSATIASLLEDNPYDDLSAFFQDIQADPETLELVARFCHGLEIKMSSDKIIPLICLSHHLKMTETHSPNNLLETSLVFFNHQILPSWDHTIRSLRSSLAGHAFQQAVDIGLFDHCLGALSAHALSHPTLLGPQPNNNNNSTRRKLFGPPTTEDLTSLPLEIYEPIIKTMAHQGVPQEYLTGSLVQYFKRHVSSNQREVIEAIERLLPNNTNTTIPYTILFEMYTLAISSDSSPGCISGLEIRVGQQLNRATVNDLRALDLDVESLRRILKGYYGNFSDADPSGLVAVAELMEGYLIEVAKEGEVDVSIFMEVAEMATSTMSVGVDRGCLDGIYRAVDIYLDKHRDLSELERDEICRVLDFNKMSREACDHATQNQRLPLRVVVQALCMSQLKLRDNIITVVGQNGNFNDNVEEEEEEKGETIKEEDDEEREIIKEGDQRSCCEKRGKKKVSLWKEMKRKFGCMSSSNYDNLHNCNCQLNKRKKVHPR